MCWDDVMQGGLLLYAINTNDSFYIGRVQKHLNYWKNAGRRCKVADHLGLSAVRHHCRISGKRGV